MVYSKVVKPVKQWFPINNLKVKPAIGTH